MKNDVAAFEAQNKLIIQSNIRKGSSIDHVSGCVLGALVGDSCGSFLEFSDSFVESEELIAKCMDMPGGGVHGVGPGQITDDGELTMCLLRGLTDSEEGFEGYGMVDENKIANYYRKWLDSDPFDIGIATTAAFSPLRKEISLANCREAASQKNKDSQSNGSLMRITPLAIYSMIFDKVNERRSLIESEVAVSHPSQTVKSSVFFYTEAIRILIAHYKAPDRASKALSWVKQLAEQEEAASESSEGPQEWLALSEIMAETAKTLTPRSGSPTLSESKMIAEFLAGINTESQGWLKWSFVLSFYFLRRWEYLQINDYRDQRPHSLTSSQFFHNSLKMSIQQGGDTDTNACIVGGMVGALVGVSGIPKDMFRKVLQFDCCSPTIGQPRPEFISPMRYALPALVKLAKIVKV